MYAECLLLAALILSAFPPSARPQRGAPTSGVTIVERARSELLSVLGNEAGATEDASLLAESFIPYLTPAGGARAAYAEARGELSSTKRAIDKSDGRPSRQPTFRRGSSCWWLWFLFGNGLCPAA